MTEAEFFEELAKVPGTPHVESGAIIIDIPTYYPRRACSITAVCAQKEGHLYDLFSWRIAAEDLDLEPTLALKIARANDRTLDYNQKMRKKILSALKLQ